MTDQEVHDAIQADPTAKALADAGNDAGCAERLSATLPPTIAPTRMAEAGILRTLGPVAGDAALSAIEAGAKSGPFASLLTRVVRILQEEAGGGLDFGDAQARSMLDTLQGAGVLDAGSVARLKAAAESPATIDHAQVSRAWLQYRPDGRVGGDN